MQRSDSSLSPAAKRRKVEAPDGSTATAATAAAPADPEAASPAIPPHAPPVATKSVKQEGEVVVKLEKMQEEEDTEMQDAPAAAATASEAAVSVAPSRSGSLRRHSDHSAPASATSNGGGASEDESKSEADDGSRASGGRAPPLEVMLRDPTVRRVHSCYTNPALFQKRFQRNWATLASLHAKLAPTHQKPKPEPEEPALAAPAAVVTAASASAAAPTGDSKTAVITSSFADSPAAAAAARTRHRQNQAALSASPSASPPSRSSKAGGPAVTAAGSKVAHKKKRRVMDPLAHMRPSSCPPLFMHDPMARDEAASERDKWPEWLQQIASPRVKPDRDSDADLAHAAAAAAASSDAFSSRKKMPPRFSYDIPASFTTGIDAPTKAEGATAAGAVGPGPAPGAIVTPVKMESHVPSWPGGGPGLPRPPFQRAATAHAISWLSASAPSTPAFGYKELALQSPVPGGAGGATVAAGSMPSPLAPSLASEHTSAASALFAVPSLPRAGAGSGLFSPLVLGMLPSTSTSVGTRPTPLVLPSPAASASSSSGSVSGALTSPLLRGMPRAPAGSGSPRFGDSVPRFGDSVLVTSIPSSSSSGGGSSGGGAVPPLLVVGDSNSSSVVAAAAAQRGLMSPVQRPLQHHTPLAGAVGTAWSAHSSAAPMSPLIMRQATLPGAGAGSSAGPGPAPGALLQEWRTLGASYLESVLRPPTIASLANATRKPVQVYAAALGKFQHLPVESVIPPQAAPAPAPAPAKVTPAGSPAQHATPSVAGSMPPPMSPLPGRRASLGVFPPLPPVPHSPLPPLVRSASEQSQSQLRTPTLAGMSGVGGAGGAGMPSPNMSRMSSYLQHAHTATATTTPGMTPKAGALGASITTLQTPMSPLGLAQPAPGQQDAAAKAAAAAAAVATAATTATTAAAATVAAAVVAESVVETAPVVVAASQSHTCSRVGPEYQAEPPAMLSQRQREWERAVYLHAHAAVHSFPKRLPPLPSQPSSATGAAGSATPSSSSSAAAVASSLPTYVPVPRVFAPPFSLPAFPASASLALTSKRSALRESIMGGRKAARRKREKEGEERRRVEEAGAGGRRGRNASAVAAAAAAAQASWEELLERDAEAERLALKQNRDARKRNRDEKRAEGGGGGGSGRASRNDNGLDDAVSRRPFRSAHPSFASFASLFPADSPFARMHFDDDTLSPYFVCSAYVRPHSPRIADPRQRSYSPVHVLSVPPTPLAGPRRTGGASGGGAEGPSRFPSSLLEPSVFSRRMAALARGEDPANDEDEWASYDDEEDEAAEQRKRERELLLLQMRRARALQLAQQQQQQAQQAAASKYAEPEEHLGGTHKHARSVKPAPRHAVPSGAASNGKAGSVTAAPKTAPGSGSGSKSAGTKRKSAATPSPSPVPSGSPVSAAAASPAAPGGGRYKRWKMVSGKRIVWWVDANGVQLTDDQVAQFQPQSEEQKQQHHLPSYGKRAAETHAAGMSSSSAAAAGASASVAESSEGEEDASAITGSERDNDNDQEDEEDAASSEADEGRPSSSAARSGSGSASSGSSSPSIPARIIIRRSRLRRNSTTPSHITSPAYTYHSASMGNHGAAGGGGSGVTGSGRPGPTLRNPPMAMLPPAATAAPAPPPKQNLSDLSPAVRVLAARTGVQRMAACIDSVLDELGDEQMDEAMERTVGVWRDQDNKSMYAHA